MGKRTPQPCTQENCGANYTKCGRSVGYAAGCRCDSCYEYNRQHCRQYRQNNAEQERERDRKKREARRGIRAGSSGACTPENCGEAFTRCGKYSTYVSWRCRCDACSQAKREYRRQYEAVPENRQKRRKVDAQWRRSNPDKVSAKNRRNYEKNAEKLRRYQRMLRVVNPGRQRATSRKYYESNREVFKIGNQIRRARLRDATLVPFTEEQWQQKCEYWGNKCYLQLPGCTGAVDHMDHVKPLSKGGAHVLANLRPACGPCNSKKYNKWPFAIPLGPIIAA